MQNDGTYSAHRPFAAPPSVYVIDQKQLNEMSDFHWNSPVAIGKNSICPFINEIHCDVISPGLRHDKLSFVPQATRSST